MMASTNNPRSTAPFDKGNAGRRPLQSLNINSKHHGTGPKMGEKVSPTLVPGWFEFLSPLIQIPMVFAALRDYSDRYTTVKSDRGVVLGLLFRQPRQGTNGLSKVFGLRSVHHFEQHNHCKDTYHPNKPTMTASPTTRYPFSTAHNRKRRPALPLQDKTLKANAVLNFVTAVDVAPSNSVAEMAVTQQDTKKTELPCYEQQLESIFRERSSVWAESRDPSDNEEEADLWSLKRASPIADEDDEEFTYYESPSKKAKVQTIFWDSRMSDDEPYQIAAMMGSR